MLHANLLPREEKQILILEQWLRVITRFGLGMCGALIIGITFLAPSYLPLYFQGKEIERSIEIQKELLKLSGNQTARTATHIKNISVSLQQTSVKHSPGSLIFDTFWPQISGIVISALTIDKEGNVVIGGKAATRRDLLGFEEHLRDSGFLQNIAAPLTNIVRESNIDFTFRGTLKPAYVL